MKKLISLSLGIVLLSMMVSATSVISEKPMFRPLGPSEVPEVYSVLHAWHVAQQSRQDTSAVRTIGRVYDPFGLHLVKPLDIGRRYDRTGYTAIYDIARQAIVPWQPGRVK